MLGHYALTDKVFETPRWSKVVMVEPTGMKPVKLIGAGSATFAPGKDECRVYNHNSYTTRERPTDTTETPSKPFGILLPSGGLDHVHDRLQVVG